MLDNDPALREAQVYACSAWNGYTIVDTTVQSAVRRAARGSLRRTAVYR